MPPTPKSTDSRVVPPARFPAERPHPRAARPAVPAPSVAPAVMGNRAFVHAWAARRAKLASSRRPV